MYIILTPFLICLLIYVAFIVRNGWYFSRAQEGRSTQADTLPFVSVIIPARNEEKNILTCLNAVLAQQYPDHLWEVILVNDHSTDKTPDIAREIASSFSKLIILDLPHNQSGKKAALSHGIRQAGGELILQTDADCVMDNNWIAAMMSYWEEGVGLISGPIKLSFRQNWLEKFQAIESMGLVCIGAASLMAGRPNMCNGANLAYGKAVFESVQGFEGIDQVASGDDELLMQKVHLQGRHKLRFAKSRAAIVLTPACKNWRDLKTQRLRWVSKARNYLDKRVNIIQLISWLAFLSFPLLLITAYWDPVFGWILFSAFLLKLAADIFLLYQAAVFFHNLHLMGWIVPLQIIYIPYVLWIGIAGNLVKTYNWKARIVR